MSLTHRILWVLPQRKCRHQWDTPFKLLYGIVIEISNNKQGYCVTRLFDVGLNYIGLGLNFDHSHLWINLE